MADLADIVRIFETTPPSQAILLEAIHGIGKSEFVKSYWESKGYRVVILFASQMADAGDLIGLPDRIEKDGTKITVFCQPWWWPKEGEKVVIFLDEVNRAKPEVLQCLQDMVLNRKLSGRTLPLETRIVAAINPQGEEWDYDVQELEASFADRFNKYEFRPTYEELLDYAIKTGWNKYIIGFLSKNSATYLDPPKQRKNPNEVYPSRRSWNRLSDILNATPSLLESSTYITLKTMAFGIVGAGATSALIQYIKENMKGINPGRIITNWDAELEKIVKTLTNQEVVMLNAELAAYFEQNESTIFISSKGKTNYARNIGRYFSCIPKEIVAEFYNHVTNAHNKGKTWAKKFLDLDDKILVDMFIDIINGESEHDKHVKNILKDDDDKEWEKT
jgi:cytidylate kinase